jgi:hypothetical protein
LDVKQEMPVTPKKEKTTILRHALGITLSLALSACGGGGGGGGSDSTPPPPPTPTPPASTRESPLQLTAENSKQAGLLAMGYGASTLGFAQLAIDTLVSINASGQLSTNVSCSNGGRMTLALRDLDGNGRPSAGDQISASLSNCFVKNLEDAFDGAYTIDLTKPEAGVEWAGSINFAPNFNLQGGSGVRIHIEGDLRFESATDLLSNRLRVLSEKQPFLLSASDASQSKSDYISQLEASREIRRDTARVSTQMRYRLASDLLGGSLQVSTVEAWGAWFDTYPDTGTLTATGADKISLQLRSSKGTSNLELGLADRVSNLVPVNDAAPGFLWSSTPLIPVTEASPEWNTKPLSAGEFKLLSAPGQTQVKPRHDSFTWQFSRPLEPNMVRVARFVKTRAREGMALKQSPPIEAKFEIAGGQLTVKPSAQLEPGCRYRLDLDYRQISAVSGESAGLPPLEFEVESTVTALPRALAPHVLLGLDATLTIDGSGSSANGGLKDMQWRQVSGPVVTLSSVSATQVLVKPAQEANGLAVIETIVRNAAGEYDRQETLVPVLAEMNGAALLSYGAAGEAQHIITNVDPGVYNTGDFARYFSVSNALDAHINDPVKGGFAIFMAHIPPGIKLSKGLDISYDGISNSQGYVSFSRPQQTCDLGPARGHMTVLDVALDANGKLQKLAIDFDADCPGSPRNFGSIRYNSTIPPRQ